MGAGASGIWEHREETQRPLHETMRLAEARLMRHAPGGSMPSQTLKHCKIQSRKDAPKMAILEAPCAQNALGRSTMRLPEALLPRNPTWESSHFWGLTILCQINCLKVLALRDFRPIISLKALQKQRANGESEWWPLSCIRGRQGGVEKRGGRKTSQMTPLPKRGFRPPSYGTFSTALQVSVLCFSCTKIHDRAEQKLFWRGPKIIGRARSLVRFPPPIRFAPPPISRPNQKLRGA